jgi:hypothetical protein
MTARKRKIKAGHRKPAARPARRKEGEVTPEAGSVVESFEGRLEHSEAGPALSGGDVDADWQRAVSSGEESVGGSVATPDQDVVDGLGRALGVEREADAELHTSDEILKARDRRRWNLERRDANEAP